MIKVYEGNIFTTSAEIIAHQVNCQGVMGAGLAKQIRDTYPEVYEAYRDHCLNHEKSGALLLGSILYQPVKNKRLCVANLFAQDKFGNGCQTDYEALKKCFNILEQHAGAKNFKVAIPFKIGCGLAGGDWESAVFPMIKDVFAQSSTELEIWKLNKTK